MYYFRLTVVTSIFVVCCCIGVTLSQFTRATGDPCSCATWTCTKWQTCGSTPACKVPRTGVAGVYEEVFDGVVYSVQTNPISTQVNALSSCTSQGFDGLVSLTSDAIRTAVSGILTRSGFKSPDVYGKEFWTSLKKNVAGTNSDITWYPSGSTYFQTSWWQSGEPSRASDLCAALTSATPSTLNDAGCTVENYYRICVATAC